MFHDYLFFSVVILSCYDRLKKGCEDLARISHLDRYNIMNAHFMQIQRNDASRHRALHTVNHNIIIRVRPASRVHSSASLSQPGGRRVKAIGFVEQKHLRRV